MSRNAAPAAFKTPAKAKAGAASARKPVARLASDEASPVASHVHDLQDLLARRLDEPAAQARWSPRATTGFVVLVCGGFWIGVALAVRMLLPR